jgi:hypothetical protein
MKYAHPPFKRIQYQKCHGLARKSANLSAHRLLDKVDYKEWLCEKYCSHITTYQNTNVFELNIVNNNLESHNNSDAY